MRRRHHLDRAIAFQCVRDLYRSETMKQITEIDDPRLVKGLAHPLRVRILRALENGTASPNELAEALGVPLGNVSYHVRFLARVGLLELVRTQPRRGAIEHFYRSRGKVRITNKAWANVPDVVKTSLIAATLAQIIEIVEAAAAKGGFDRPDVVVSRRSAALDEQGVAELNAACQALLDRAGEIEQESGKRLAAHSDHKEGVSTGMVLMVFEEAETKQQPDAPRADPARKRRSAVAKPR
jgi:DNA-binding transcriptional ArsR family regulator